MIAQDFTKGVDLSGLVSVTGEDIDNMLELGTPTANGSAELGKGLALVSTDSALDIPDVPDATATTKWKRYLWLRRPFAGSTDQRVIPYAWNDNATSDATYLKWLALNADSDTLTTLAAVANNALSTANDAVSTADAASVNSATAVSNAATAIADSAAATATANTSVVTANAAQASANGAIVTANNANVASAAALNAATVGTVDIARLIGSGNIGDAGKVLRVNSDATTIEIVDASSLVAIFSEVNVGNAAASAVGANLRVLNTTILGATWAILTGAGRITLTKGKYLIEGFTTGYGINFISLIYNNTTAAYLAYNGNSVYGTGTAFNSNSRVTNYVEIVAATEDIEIRTFADAIVANGLGRGAGLPAVDNRYSGLKITRLN